GLLMPARRFGLWESPTGLIYFNPMIAGDEPFYRTFYGKFGMHDKLAGARTQRLEFLAAAKHVPIGARVLDVGCGHGGFRAYVPGATSVASTRTLPRRIRAARSWPRPSRRTRHASARSTTSSAPSR
ncbi:MAG TPA: hypothetical protein VGO82_01115, partial [Enterovirga sp.]|nr:hypothetical protein [Enterovirga sp.]